MSFNGSTACDLISRKILVFCPVVHQRQHQLDEYVLLLQLNFYHLLQYLLVQRVATYPNLVVMAMGPLSP